MPNLMIRFEKDRRFFPDGRAPMFSSEGELDETIRWAKELNDRRFGGQAFWHITEVGGKMIVFPSLKERLTRRLRRIAGGAII